MTTAFGITDEIFAVALPSRGMICPAYLYGLIAIAFLGWVLGTLLGAAAGQICRSLSLTPWALCCTVCSWQSSYR
ncbi:MAG: AzlC family ABC transporter permease [Ruminococcus callidus]